MARAKSKRYISEIPLLINEWDWVKNTVSPYELTCGSAKLCYWICSTCNHSWSAVAYSRSNGRGCPECARKNRGTNKTKNAAKKNSFAEKFPDIAKQWHPTKNGDLKPQDVSSASNKKIWWLCEICGHEWQATVGHRTIENNSCPKCAKKLSAEKKIKTHAKRNNFLSLYPEIAKQWHPTKNGDLKPQDVSASHNGKVWWLCDFCGNEWQTSVNQRTRSRNCPNCSKAQTSLAEQLIFFYIRQKFPDAINRYKGEFEFDIFIPSKRIAIEYDGAFFHNSKDSLLKDNLKDLFCKEKGIQLIRFRSPKLADTVWATRITCEDYQIKEGILELFSVILSSPPEIDIDKDRLTVIQNYRQEQKEQSLASKYPEIAKEWHPTKNGHVNPFSIMPMSNIKFWWKCKKCGYDWEAAPNHRVGRGSACPVCAGKVVVPGHNDLSTVAPNIAKEWNYEKNSPLLPTQVTSHSNKKVWWKCQTYGHEWEASIKDRIETECPYCKNRKVLAGFNDLATTNPKLAKEWNYCKNSLKPTEVTSGSQKKVWWICSKCNFEWEAVIYSRKNCGCPRCAGKIK